MATSLKFPVRARFGLTPMGRGAPSSTCTLTIGPIRSPEVHVAVTPRNSTRDPGHIGLASGGISRRRRGFDISRRGDRDFVGFSSSGDEAPVVVGSTRSRRRVGRLRSMVTEASSNSYLGVTAIVTALYQFSFFVIAAGFKIDKVTDFAGTTNFVVLAVLTLILNGTYQYRQLVLTTFVLFWGIRLGFFLLFRILSWGEDHRFDDKRNNLLRFAVFWFLQGVWVWTVSLPVTVVNGSSKNPAFGVRDYVGWAMWGVGLAIEAIADQSKLNFKNSISNKGLWCDVGLWSWSRHPNYFGEMLLWWGIFVAATPVLSGGQWAVITGPILLSCLLLFVSGIPLLEISADKKHRSNPEYLHYKNTTSPLIPLPPAVYGILPAWFKKTFLFEFAMYSKKLGAGNHGKNS